MSKDKKSSTLWGRYSMLKTMISLNENIEMKKFSKLISLLKTTKKGYQPKKVKVFTGQEIQQFLNEAPNIKYLAIKVNLKRIVIKI